MKRAMLSMVAISFAAMVLFCVLYYKFANGWILTLAITSGTIFYHMGIRLLIGYVINVAFAEHINTDGSYFKQKSFENGLYKALRVKEWKRFMPTFNADEFSMALGAERIIKNSCVAEVVHIICAVFSLFAVSFFIFFGEFFVFLITSVLGAVFDVLFVLMQRFNRPRLLRFAKKQSADKNFC